MNKLIKVPYTGLILITTLQESGYEANFVGGCVRDSLLGLTPNDWDITSNATPDKLIEIFKGYKVIPTGLKHGTITVMVDDQPYEVTTYRTDGTYSNGRQPDSVTFVTDLKEDLARRDFTINAMAYDPISDILFDPFNGQGDLQFKAIKAVGNAEDRFQEDHLRMLRAVRYSSRFDFILTADIIAAVSNSSQAILLISKERVFQELYKMASESGKKFSKSLQWLKGLGLLEHILPEIDMMDQYPHAPETHPEGGVWPHVLACIECNHEADPVLNLAILFHDVGKPATFTNDGRIRYLLHHEVGLGLIEEISRRLRMSNELRDTLKFVCKWHMVFHKIAEMSDYKLTQLVLHKDWEILYKASRCDDASRGSAMFNNSRWANTDVRVCILKDRAAEKAKFDRIKAAVPGELVMKLRGLPPSKKVGEVIEKTLEYIINEKLDIDLDKDKISEFICHA